MTMPGGGESHPPALPLNGAASTTSTKRDVDPGPAAATSTEHEVTLRPHDHLEVRNWQEAVAMGLPWPGSGYGVLLCTDSEDTRVSLVTDDVACHRMLVGAGSELRADLEIPRGRYGLRRSGWPPFPSSAAWELRAT